MTYQDFPVESTPEKAGNRVFKVLAEEDEVKYPAKREYYCRVCDKKHARFACSYKCKYCKRKGRRSEACWVKFPEKAPGYIAPPPKEKPRDPTPGPNKKKRGRRSKSQGSDRGIDYDASSSEAGSPQKEKYEQKGEGCSGRPEETSHGGVGSSNTDSLFLWEPSQTKNRLFINRVKVVKQEDVEDEEDCYAGIADPSDGMVYS